LKKYELCSNARSLSRKKNIEMSAANAHMASFKKEKIGRTVMDLLKEEHGLLLMSSWLTVKTLWKPTKTNLKIE